MNDDLCSFSLHCQASQQPSVKNQGFELGKYKNASIISHAYMPHYIRHPHLLEGGGGELEVM